MSQKESWTDLNSPGDWILEERRHKDGKVSFHLCMIGATRREENVDSLPQDLVDVLVKGGAMPVKTTGWEG